VDTVPDPKIRHPRDAVIKITACAICGSDLHLLDGYQPTMESGDILGHENMGEVIELGSEVTNLKIGDRVVVPFTISCGQCWFCEKGLFSCCDRTNPNAELAAKAMGQSPAGLFGFSHMLGGYSGGQAEYLRVPMADVGPIKIPDSVTDEQALFLSDIFPSIGRVAQQARGQKGFLLQLNERALLRLLIRPPPQNCRTMSKPAAGEVVVAYFDDPLWLDRHPLCRTLGRPAAGTGRRVPREAGICDLGFEHVRQGRFVRFLEG
jgi:hypothetical protein